MSAFTENALIKKLGDLNTSSQSIQTLSLWLIHHRKHHEKIVKIWILELVKGIFFFFFTLIDYRINNL
jgi:regulator of Ty1 transposition protein 103